MRTFVIGVGLTRFEKPGTKPGDYPDWVREAGTAALRDAGVGYEQVEQAYVGYVYGDSTAGQRAVYELGLTGIPVVNVNNNCATGSTALFLARQAVAHGAVDCMRIVGSQMSQEAAKRAYREAGIRPADVDVCELHDCFSTNELITYEALGFAAEGEGQELVRAEATTYGGSGPLVNPSGGLISKGHPLGATGLAQCSELTWQLRGEADARQLEGAKVGLQHNIGLGGAAVVTVYKPPV